MTLPEEDPRRSLDNNSLALSEDFEVSQNYDNTGSSSLRTPVHAQPSQPQPAAHSLVGTYNVSKNHNSFDHSSALESGNYNPYEHTTHRPQSHQQRDNIGAAPAVHEPNAYQQTNFTPQPLQSQPHQPTRDSLDRQSVRTSRSVLHRASTRLSQRSRRGSTESRKSIREQIIEEEREPETVEGMLDAIVEEDEKPDDIVMDVREAAADLNMQPAEKARGYKENRVRHRAIQRYASGSKAVLYLRRLYTDILSRTLVTRLFIWWLPLAILLFIPLACDAFGSRSLALGSTRVMWIFIWLEVAWAALFVGKILARYMPETFGIIVSIIAPKYFRVIDALVALEFPITMVIWAFVSFITFIPLLSRNHQALKDATGIQPWHRVVNNILVALFVSSLVYLAEQIFVHVLSANYHGTRMALRIKASKKAISVLTLLLELSYGFFPQGCEEFFEEDTQLTFMTLAVGKNANARLQKFSEKNVVAKNFSKAITETTNMIGAMARDLKRTPTSKVVKQAMASRHLREVLANRIWKSLVMEDSDALTFDEILQLLGENRKEEVLYIFDILDADGQEGITVDDMVESVNAIGKETKAISRSLQDIDGAIVKLHKLLLFACLIVVIIIFVGMLAPSVGTVLATLGSSLLALSFIFSSTAAELMSSIIFLFVKHPCDVGDIVYIMCDNVGYARLTVIELSLLYTVFQDNTSNMIRQVPNATLNSLFIDNASRSPPMTVHGSLVLGIPETTTAKIEELRQLITKYVDDHPRDFMPGLFFQVTAMPDLDRVNVYYSVTCRNNMEDITLFDNRQTRFLQNLARLVNQLGLQVPRREDPTHNDPALPFYTVALDPGSPRVRGMRRPQGMYPEDDATTLSEMRTKADENVLKDDNQSVISRTTSAAAAVRCTGLRRTNTSQAPRPTEAVVQAEAVTDYVPPQNQLGA